MRDIGRGNILVILAITAGVVIPMATLLSIEGLRAHDQHARNFSDAPGHPPVVVVHPTCAWKFFRYVPSDFEASWVLNITVNQADVCGRFRGAYGKYWRAYMNLVPRLTPGSKANDAVATNCTRDGYGRIPRRGFPGDTFSVMEYIWECDAGTLAPPLRLTELFIEPLAGILRHPAVCENFDKMLVDKNYMLLDGWRPVAPKRRFYFDVGASTWTSGAGGASQEWMVRTYEELCTKFDQIYAWEAAPTPTDQVLSQLPADVVAKYHWYNVPASSEPGNKLNPLTLVLSETEPDDYVVLKLDVDNWQVEEALVRQILDSQELASRIDEMFWEHHADFQPMAGPWGGAVHRGFSMGNSIRIFAALRQRGIRAHSWV